MHCVSLISIIYADGYIDEKEVELTMIIAEQMGLEPSIVTEIIEKLESLGWFDCETIGYIKWKQS